jgi:methyltransferase FkbM-like protein
MDAYGLIDLAPPPDAEAFTVKVTTLDAEVARLGVVPGVVRIDVRGAELEVLRGGRELLGKHGPLLFLELHLDALEARGVAPDAIVELLRGHGYRFETPLGRRLSPTAVASSPDPVLHVVAR